MQDLQLPKGRNREIPMVTIIGKGNKTRRCPLWESTTKLLLNIVSGKSQEDPVFLNRLGGPITRFGIYEMITRYAEQIESYVPSIKRKRVSPHTIRHTTATHLLQSGVDINTIRAWLGHVCVDTTNIYAEVNMEMKAKALDTCAVSIPKKSSKLWTEDKDLMSFLDSL